MDEYIDFLEPAAAHIDPETGAHIPARSGAICQSSVDWNRLKTAAEKMCRELGPRCKPEVVQAINTMKRLAKSLKVKN